MVSNMIPSIVASHRPIIRANRTKRTRVSAIVDRSGMPDRTGYDLSTLLSSIRGGFEGLQKLLRASAYKSVRRAFAQYDFQPESDMVRQIVDDTTDVAWSAVCERFTAQWNPSKGAISTWICHTVWFVISNHVRDEVIPNMIGVHMTDQSDRDGASPQQGMDRFLNDHAGKAHYDRNGIDDREDLDLAYSIVSDLPTEMQMVLESSLDESDTDDRLADRMKVSRARISQIRNEMRDLGIESKRSRLHR